VKLKGLNIRKNGADVWYASFRANGTLLGKAESREALRDLMETPAFLQAYVLAQTGKRKIVYPDGTFGALVDWYQTKPEWTDLAERTREDYQKALNFLEPAYAYSAPEIEMADVVELRDQAAAEHHDKFSDTVVAVMSAVFRTACDAGRLKGNPALGVKRLYKADKDANRAWKPAEWETVLRLAPAHLRAPLAIARWAGLRGQDLAVIKWDSYRDDPEMGKALVFVPLKNGDEVGEVTVGVLPQLRAVLDAMSDGVLPSAPICRNSLGMIYPSANALRKVWQDFKASKSFKAALPNSSDLTLHGLRVTMASELRDEGFSNRAIADALGDMSESMGQRYSRGAEQRKTSVRVFQKMAKGA
jgi:integrase